jgi:aspartate dehydrogenase
VEAAGRAAIQQWAPAALAAAPEMIIASTSALCDDGLLMGLTGLAEQCGSRIRIPSVAIGGMDALASAAVLELEDVVHQIVKPPHAWINTPAERLLDLGALTERTTFFTGTARDAATAFPQNANATIVTSLAGIGLDRTRIELVANPAATMNGHRIVVRGALGHLEIVLEHATGDKSEIIRADCTQSGAVDRAPRQSSHSLNSVTRYLWARIYLKMLRSYP